MTDTMRAVVLTGHGGLDMLEYRTDYPKPVAGNGEVLIRVGACGMNNTDINTRSAWYSKGVTDATTGDALAGAQDDDSSWGGAEIQFPRIQGADVVGTVEAVGQGADPALIGKRVMVDTWLRDWDDPLNKDKAGYYGSECDGGYAEYTKIDHRHVHAIESNLSDAELATFATASITAENMLRRAKVTDGDIVLIPGASGGVGSALIQLARRRGAKAVALCSASKLADVRAIGADLAIDRNCGDIATELQSAFGRTTVDVLADVVGGPQWPALLDLVARGGRLTCAGAIAGPMVEFDLRTFYLRDLTFTGATVVPPGVFADLVGYIARNEIKPLLAATYSLDNFVEGQQAFIDKKHVGNIVVTP